MIDIFRWLSLIGISVLSLDALPSIDDKSKAPSNLTEIISILTEASTLPWHLNKEKEDETMADFHPGTMELSAKVQVNPSNLYVKSSSKYQRFILTLPLKSVDLLPLT